MVEVAPIQQFAQAPLICFIWVKIHAGSLQAAGHEPDGGENPDRFWYVFKPVQHQKRNIALKEKGAEFRALHFRHSEFISGSKRC